MHFDHEGMKVVVQAYWRGTNSTNPKSAIAVGRNQLIGKDTKGETRAGTPQSF